jgi:hypothetical protein
MDLATHFTGVVNTGSFTPGAATPAPFNVSHTGLVNGAGPSSASKNVAEIYNRILLNNAALVNMLGSTVDNTNWVQASAVLKAYLDTMNTNTASLNTNLNTVSAGLAAEIAARTYANDWSAVRRATDFTIPAGSLTNVAWDSSMGLNWYGSGQIVVPALRGGNFEVAFALSLYSAPAQTVTVIFTVPGGTFFREVAINASSQNAISLSVATPIADGQTVFVQVSAPSAGALVKSSSSLQVRRLS